MTKKEAIQAMYFYREKLQNGIFNQYIHAFDVAISALRAQPVNIDRSCWKGCDSCVGTINKNRMVKSGRNYCPFCGKPLSEEAWVDLARKIGVAE